MFTNVTRILSRDFLMKAQRRLEQVIYENIKSYGTRDGFTISHVNRTSLFVYRDYPVEINYTRKLEREEKNDRFDVFKYRRPDLMVHPV